MVVMLIVNAILAGVLGASTPVSPAAEPEFGTIAGIVTDADGQPITYANVILLGTRLGASTAEDGSFRIANTPVGGYRMKVLAIGFEPAIVPVTVRANGLTRVPTIAVSKQRWGLSDSAAARVLIGTDVPSGGKSVTCRIRPRRATIHVGEHPAFDVQIANGTDSTLWLVPSLDGSARGARYPQVEIQIQGPPDGFQVPLAMACGNMNGLAEQDFVELKAGKSFDPFASGWLPHSVVAGTFRKPGKYVGTFRYSTNEPDVRKWLGWPPPSDVSEVMAEHLRHVPLLEIECATEFEVVE